MAARRMTLEHRQDRYRKQQEDEPKMPDATRNRSTKTTAQRSAHDIQHQIRERAYELYERRGRNNGHDLDDWLTAESEVTQKAGKRAA